MMGYVKQVGSDLNGDGVYTVPLNTMYSFYGDPMDKGTANISSIVKAQSGVCQKLLDKMYDDFEKIEK